MMGKHGQPTERERLIINLNDHANEMSVDELRAMNLLAARLEMGRVRYGALDLASDPRDFELEADAEASDLLLYLAFARLARRAHL
jgi:hypothetical protein